MRLRIPGPRVPWASAGPVAVLVVCALALTACAGGSPPDEAFRLDRNTEFDGEKLRLFVMWDDGIHVSVNTADDVYEDTSRDHAHARPPGAGPGRSSRSKKATRRSPTPC